MTLDTKWAIRWMKLSQEVIAENRVELIELDRQIGDGDHGENLDRGFTAMVKALDETPCETVGEVFKIVAKTLMSTVGGAAGPLYGTAFLRAAKEAGSDSINASGVLTMLTAALGGIQARGKAQVGEKTMVDAWSPAVEAAREIAGPDEDGVATLEAAAKAARAGAEATKPMKATKGRASYLGERSIGHLDPGAVSSALILEQAVEAARE
ncbi:MAG: dihydroxyacetone kinase subunit DhaL [Actinomycetaceae bacterium]|nr:dihydroxyacetone kinase subunit DhaL [Actinomycetaceae bacterium]